MQAFHWFANEDSLREIYRVLKPTGAFIMFANREDDRDAWARAILCSFEPYSRVGHLTALPHVCLYAEFAAYLSVKSRLLNCFCNRMRPYPDLMRRRAAESDCKPNEELRRAGIPFCDQDCPESPVTAGL